MNKVTILYFLILFSMAPIAMKAQLIAEVDKTPKLIGKRYITPISYRGPQYIYSDTKWIPGTVFLTNGDSVANLLLKYNRQQDELIYFNQKNTASVMLDKKQLAGFAFYFGNDRALFRKISTIHLYNKAGYYEVLYDGKTDVLAHRGSELKICPSYMSNMGLKKNREFVACDRYLILGKENELLPIRLRKKSLLLKFGEIKKKEIVRIIRKQHLSMKDEASMIHTWKALEAQGYNPVF